MSDYVSLNGQIVPYEHARIAPFDSGFLHGIGLFETMRAKAGRVELLDKHLARLQASSLELQLSVEPSAEAISASISELLEANNLSDARIRLTVSHGDMTAADPDQTDPPHTVLLSAAQFTAYPPQFYEQGITVEISNFYQNPDSPLCGHKSISYMDRMFVLRSAQKTGAAEAIWFTAGEKWLAEGCISNVFLVNKVGELCTPPLRMPGKPHLRLVLPGIMRQLVIDTARQRQLKVEEKMLRVEDLLLASEIFITNSIMGITPVVRVERHPVGNEKPGSVTQMLRTAMAQV